MNTWRWTDERGVQRRVSTAELRTALAAGVIPGSTLVWRQGMEAWMPASQLPELADAARVGREPESGASGAEGPADTSSRGAARESGVMDLDFELLEELGPEPARGGQRAGATAANRPVNDRKPAAQASRAETRPPPPPPRKRESMRTLTGVEAPENAPASGQSAPIVVPAAGGTFDAGVARAITQLPRYEGAPTGDEGATVIPRAPKLPSESEGQDDPLASPLPAIAGFTAAGGASAKADGNTPGVPRRPPGAAPSRPATAAPSRPATAAPSRPATAAPSRPATAAPSRPGAAPRAAGEPVAGATARPPQPLPRPPGRDATPATAAAQDQGRGAAAGGAGQGPGRPLPAVPPAPTGSSPGARGPARAAGRSAPPHPVPVRISTTPPRRLGDARAPEAPAQAAAGAKALVRLGALPAPPPRPPAEAPRATPPATPRPPAPAADAALTSSAAAAASTAPVPRPPSPLIPGDGPLPRSAAAAPASDGRDAPANRARGESIHPSAAAPSSDTKEPSAASFPAPNETTKRSPLVEAPPGRPAPATTPSASAAPIGAASAAPAGAATSAAPTGAAASTAPAGAAASAAPAGAAPAASPAPGLPLSPLAARPWSGPAPAPPGAQRNAAAADARLGSGTLASDQRADSGSAASSSNGPAALPPRALAARRGQPPRAGRLGAMAEGAGNLFSTPVPVRVSSLLGLGGAALLVSVGAFFAGRLSAASPRRAPIEPARSALGAAQEIARAALPAPPAPPKPCWVARQPQQWAPLVAKSIPFEVTTTKQGKLVVGYAKSPMEAVGLEIDPATGERNERFSNTETADIVSISPIEDGFTVLTAAQQAIRSPVNVPGPTPFVVGLAGGAVVAADSPDAAPSRLWPVQGDEPLEAPRALAAGSRGYAVAFRREKAVWAGWLDAERKPAGELTRVAGSGGSVGKPSIGWNGRDLAVVFADRPTDGRWEIRAGRAASSTPPASTQVIPLPTGGPGGDAFAPDIAGLGDGRWLLVWTEGPPGSRAMRAQTLAADFTPVGDPIALSPPAGNFGQGLLGVSARSGYVGVVFLSKPAASYELWGVILQCG
ncbi:GYF domain-containing protein [Sorangium sp. So ce131]|uniref:GYF domain-containing protein n=1 Tax=Sorangium sp. So ce131 TaxID=3133282 RepID=UPI003F62ABE6